MKVGADDIINPGNHLQCINVYQSFRVPAKAHLPLFLQHGRVRPDGHLCPQGEGEVLGEQKVVMVDDTHRHQPRPPTARVPSQWWEKTWLGGRAPGPILFTAIWMRAFSSSRGRSGRGPGRRCGGRDGGAGGVPAAQPCRRAIEAGRGRGRDG